MDRVAMFRNGGYHFLDQLKIQFPDATDPYIHYGLEAYPA